MAFQPRFPDMSLNNTSHNVYQLWLTNQPMTPETKDGVFVTNLPSRPATPWAEEERVSSPRRLPVARNDSHVQHRRIEQNPYFPLHSACATGELTRVKSVLVPGTDINLKNYSGQTPLDVAAINGHKQIVDFLLLCSKTWRCDIDVSTARQIAIEKKFWEIAVLLGEKRHEDMMAMLMNAKASDEEHMKRQKEMMERNGALNTLIHKQRKEINRQKTELRAMKHLLESQMLGMDERISGPLKPNTKFISNKMSWGFQQELHASRIRQIQHHLQRELARKETELKHWKKVAQNHDMTDDKRELVEVMDRLQEDKVNTFQMWNKIFSAMTEWSEELQSGFDLLRHFVNSDESKVQQCLDEMISQVEMQFT